MPDIGSASATVLLRLLPSLLLLSRLSLPSPRLPRLSHRLPQLRPLHLRLLLLRTSLQQRQIQLKPPGYRLNRPPLCLRAQGRPKAAALQEMEVQEVELLEVELPEVRLLEMELPEVRQPETGPSEKRV